MKMPEKFLHLVWNHLLFEFSYLQSNQNEPIKIVNKGKYNFGQGPDFKEAVIEIQNIQWNGNIEIETHSQNWYEHKHHKNPEFNSVILLVCYEHDDKVKIINSNGWEIPVLVLKPFILQEVINKLEILLQQEIPCKPFIPHFPTALQKSLLTQKAMERLDNKVMVFKGLDLEMISWKLLWKAFGDPYHSDFFLEISEKLNPQYFFECTEILEKEAIAFGIAGFLNGIYEDSYFHKLKELWNYLKVKYSLTEINPQFVNFKTRFHSYPHILLVQLVAWFHEHGNLLLLPQKFYFENFGKPSNYWQNHTFFDRPSKVKIGIGKQKILKLLLNWYFPFHWHYAKYYQKENMEKFLEEFSETEKEDSQLIKKMENWGWKIENGLESQGVIELYKKFCLERRCLECGLGQWYLKNKKESILFNG